MLQAPKGYATRPTGSRVKEALFNTIQGLEPEARVLDLFAGSGALGLEALSRGASSAIFVENSAGALKSLTYNIKKAGWQERVKIIPSDVLSFLNSYKGKPFDLIFMDPPYNCEKWPEIFGLLSERKMLEGLGMLVWELPASMVQIQPVKGFELVKKKQYGDTALLFYKSVKGESDNGCV